MVPGTGGGRGTKQHEGVRHGRLRGQRGAAIGSAGEAWSFRDLSPANPAPRDPVKAGGLNHRQERAEQRGFRVG